MREHHAAQHNLFGQLLGFGFNHHHGVAGGSHDQVEVAIGGIALLGVEGVFTVDVAYARGADRAHEGHAGNGQGSRGGDQRDDVGLGLAVERHDLRDHVDLVVEPFGEQRTDGTVDQAAGQRFLFGRAALTLEEAARDAPGG